MTAALTSVGVQYGSITIATGATTGTASITAVGAGAYIKHLGHNSTESSNVNGNDALVRVELTNTGLVTATRGASSATKTTTVKFCVVDGDLTNLVVSVQSGTTTLSSIQASNTSTISAVTNANAMIEYLGFSTPTGNATLNDILNHIALSGTTVTVTRNLAAVTALTTGWCVIDYQGAALNSATQNISIATSTTSATTYTATISSVTTANSRSAYNGCIVTLTTNADISFGRGQIASATTYTIIVNSAANSLRTYKACVAEFVAGVLTSNATQRGTITLTAATSNTATITAVTVAQAEAGFGNNTTTSTPLAFDTYWFAITLTNTTTVTETANTAITGTGSFEITEFNPVAAGGVAFANWMAAFDERVKAPPSSAQFSDVIQEINPQPIPQMDWYCFNKPEVIPPKPAAQFTQVAQKILPSPIAQNNFYLVFDPQVKPPPRAPDTRVFVAQKINPQPIGQNNFYPVFDPRVKPVLPAAGNTQITAPAPTIFNTFAPIYWYPQQAFEVKAGPLNNKQTLSQALPQPIAIINWYPQFDQQVKPGPKAALLGSSALNYIPAIAPPPPPSGDVFRGFVSNVGRLMRFG